MVEKLRRRQQPNALTRRNNEAFIGSVTDFLDRHFMELLTLQELGERFHISPYYLSHLFKDETSLSPMKYVIYRKIGESQRLLMNTKLSIGAVGERLGFGDNCHFSMNCKKTLASRRPNQAFSRAAGLMRCGRPPSILSGRFFAANARI